MEPILTEEEIRALQDALGPTSTHSVPQQGARQEARLVDITRGRRIASEEIQPLGPYLEETRHRVSSALARSAHRPVGVTLAPPRPVSYGEWLGQAEDPVVAALLVLDEPCTKAAMMLRPAFLFHLLAVAMGGSAGAGETRVPDVAERGLTSVETTFVRFLGDTFLSALSAAVQPIAPLKGRLQRTELSRVHAEFLTPETVVVALDFTVRVADVEDQIRMALPQQTVVELARLARRAAEGAGDDVSAEAALSVGLLDATVTVAVELGRTSLRLEDLAFLEPETVLRLDTHPQQPLLVRVAGVPKFVGVPVVHQGNMALKITGEIYNAA